MNVDLIPIPLIAILSFLCSIPVFILHRRNIKLVALPIAIILFGHGIIYSLFGLLGLDIQMRAFIIRIGIITTNLGIAIISILAIKYRR